VAGQSLAPAVVAGHSTPVAYCLTVPGATPGAGGASPYECLVPAAAFNVPWTIAVINPVILVTNISEQVSRAFHLPQQVNDKNAKPCSGIYLVFGISHTRTHVIKQLLQ